MFLPLKIIALFNLVTMLGLVKLLGGRSLFTTFKKSLDKQSIISSFNNRWVSNSVVLYEFI